MTLRRALDLSGAATVQRADGRRVRVRLLPGWERPASDWLDDAATSGGGSVLDLAVLGGALLRGGVRVLRYRWQGRRDWWLVRQVDDEEPTAARHPDRAGAAAEAERLLQAEVAAGGRYLPHG